MTKNFYVSVFFKVITVSRFLTFLFFMDVWVLTTFSDALETNGCSYLTQNELFCH